MIVTQATLNIGHHRETQATLNVAVVYIREV